MRPRGRRARGVSSFVVPAMLALLLTPLLATAAPAGNAIHPLTWDDRVVADTSGALLPQDSSMPCVECHDMGNPANASIYSFSTARTGGVAITVVRELCEGCHHPSDAPGDPVVVQGLVLAPLPSGPAEHTDADATPCSDCHGASGHNPVGHGSAGGDCGDAGCHGGSGSHGIHLSDSDARGPGELACADCHLSGDFPYFAAGSDDDSSGHIELDETTVCDACHSPGGSYDGVDSTMAPSGALSVGAKDHWASKVYATGNSLQAGKERWCVGCHDGVEAAGAQAASLIDGVYAPPVGGDESASYIYGTGWGFYETGHGTPSSTVIPSNGFDPGPSLGCDDCHDYTQAHIDGARRTFTAASGPTGYRTGYRLDLVGGSDPMLVPWPSMTSNSSDNYRLCTQSGCHDPYPFLNENASDRRTNLWNEIGTGDPKKYNMHKYHLEFFNQMRWPADWGGSLNSGITCVSCHNVHGSQYLGMIHDGSLISDTVDRADGLRMWYWDDTLSVWAENNPDPPTPEDITLAMSDGWVWRGNTSGRLCSHCHGNNNTLDVPRSLWQSYGIAPVLSWTGTPGYESDGVDPDSGSAADTFTFKVEYADGNNDAPSYVTLLLDRNDDGDFGDAGEAISMDADNPGDVTYFDGNGYHSDVTLAKAGDDVLSYRFETSDGVSGTSTTPTRTVTVTNAAPALVWTGDTGYETDGVSPNSGTTDVTTYEFRIEYADADGEAPSGGVTLHVDKNDDGDFSDAGENVGMTDMGDPSYVAGKRYTYSTTLTYGVDGLVPYYFTATDGTDAVQSATATATVLLDINQAPVLAWTGEPDYVTDGVDPEDQAATKPFFFRIEYTDANNDPPGVRQVWIDLDDDAVYEPGEKFVMDDSLTATSSAATDGDYSNGEYFAESVPVGYAGDGTLTYRFYFEDDNAAEATGVQATDRTLSVYQARDVPAEYPTIQDAVDAANTSDTVLVADGTYAGFAFNNKDIYVESVNGSASTFIEQTGGRCVDFNYYGGNPSNSILTGFTLQNSSYGVYTNLSRSVVRDCVFDGNATGLYNGSASSYPVTVEDCVFQGSTSTAVFNNNNTGIITFRRSEFTGNTGTSGSCLSGNGGVFTYRQCSFQGNSATTGGALYANGITKLTLSDCVFTDNTATGDGGAIYFVGNGSGTDAWIDRTVFAGNSSANGGALDMRMGDYELTNCTIVGNYATGQGGGARTGYGGRPVFTNCTIADNSADTGGGIYSLNNALGQCDVHNCVVWGNDSRGSVNEAIDSNRLDRVEVQSTDIDQTYTGFASQTGNMTSDPLFVDALTSSAAPTSTGDYHIQVGSPVEGQASATLAPADDIDRGARPQGTGDDMGSDEIGAAAAMRLVPAEHTLPVSEIATEPTPPHELPGALTPLGLEKATLVSVAAALERMGSEPVSAGGESDVVTLTEVGGAPLGSDPLPALPAAVIGTASILALAWRAIVEFVAGLR